MEKFWKITILTFVINFDKKSSWKRVKINFDLCFVCFLLFVFHRKKSHKVWWKNVSLEKKEKIPLKEPFIKNVLRCRRFHVDRAEKVYVT